MEGLSIIHAWLQQKGWNAFPYQEQTWNHIVHSKSGIVNAPTGMGKTFAVFLGSVIRFINAHPQHWKQKKQSGLQLLWITPLRALAKDIGRAMEEALTELDMPWKVGIRNGDTSTAERQQQKKSLPEILIITPESLHLLLSSKNHAAYFEKLDIIAVDEWHELLGSKRGVQTELAISRIIHCNPLKTPMVWGISATIGNLEEARSCLLSPVFFTDPDPENGVLVRADIKKEIDVIPVFPTEVEKYPWAGHLGIKLADAVLPILEQSRSTLIFINTRGMSEVWYQTLLQRAPELAGTLALHHGSIDRSLRNWVEDALHAGTLKAVVCTASLDLGVDFRPVETVIQVGSPKGVARFLQRAGRSGHAPGQTSRIYFLPTHSLELIEAAALKEALAEKKVESKNPLLRCFDVLIQYLCTLACADGFDAQQVREEVMTTHCFRDMLDHEWMEIMSFITTGGNALQQYDEYQKVVRDDDGLYKMVSRRMIMRHRMHIGTIVSDAMMNVKWMSGGYVGVIEEGFISKLQPGDVFTLAGKNLELVSTKDMTVQVRKSNAKKSIVPSWMGGRMPLSANLGSLLRKKLSEAVVADSRDEILKKLEPVFELQRSLSAIPAQDELLIELIETRDGHHLFVHTFEGRLVNEAMAAILAWRISRMQPMSFSFAMNDYSFELLSDQPIPLNEENIRSLFSTTSLSEAIQHSVNATEMAKRKFRDIAVIGGLVFQGMPGEKKKARHLQSSASLLFQVFMEFDRHNILLKQAFDEVMDAQMEEERLRAMLERISNSTIVIKRPRQLTPFSFPVKVDAMRESMSSEKLEDRVRKMQLALLK
jgi:ATP-dependent helicase Lhr and Lhr-like helicase